MDVVVHWAAGDNKCGLIAGPSSRRHTSQKLLWTVHTSGHRFKHYFTSANYRQVGGHTFFADTKSQTCCFSRSGRLPGDHREADNAGVVGSSLGVTVTLGDEW